MPVQPPAAWLKLINNSCVSCPIMLGFGLLPPPQSR